jgi:hypothetical protein
LRPIELTRAFRLWLIACVAFVSAHASPVETIHECVERLKPPAHGIEALAAQCPDLKAALTQLGYSETLAPGWQERLTPGQLEDLAALATRYHLDPPPSLVPDVGAVRGILDRLASERVSAAPKSWWESIKDWLRSWFSSKEHDLSWLERWSNKLSTAAGVLTIVTFALVALVIVGSLVYIVIELRSSGAFARSARRSTGAGAHVDSHFPGDSRPSNELDRASIFDQPALLLALVVRSLNRGGRLAADRHLTHRELARIAQLDDSHQRDRLTRLAGIAEELLYGAREPSLAMVHSAVQDGRELLRQIEEPRGVAP